MIQAFEFYGTGRQIDAKGRYFRYESGADGSGVVDINLTIDGNRIGRLSPGDDIELPTEATRWEILPVSSGCVGLVRVGNARITSQKMQGVVQTVDGGRARSLAGVAFAGYAYRPEVSGQFALVQLWNKVGSGKTLIVGSASVLSNVNSGGSMTIEAAPLSALVQPGRSKKAGEPSSSAAEIRSEVRVASTANPLRTFTTGFGQDKEYRPTEPIVLPAGYGLTFCTTSAGVNVGVSFDWFEE